MQLGIKVRDRITGFEGIVTGYVQYLTGCNQSLVVPKAKDGALVQPEWFDVQRLEQCGDAVMTLDNGDTPGCDRAPPKR